WKRAGGQNFPREGTQAALGAVAQYGVADLLRSGKADTGLRIAIGPVAGLKEEPPRPLPPGRGGLQVVGALAQHAKRNRRRANGRFGGGALALGLRRCHSRTLTPLRAKDQAVSL